jgi:hypothetical protein
VVNALQEVSMTDTLHRLTIRSHGNTAEVYLDDAIQVVVISAQDWVSYYPAGDNTPEFWRDLEAALEPWGLKVDTYLDSLTGLNAAMNGYAAALRISAIEGGGQRTLPIRPKLGVA